jgi:hypothetical protein
MLRSTFRRLLHSTQNRTPITCKPRVETLERRDVPAVLTLPQSNLPQFDATFLYTPTQGQPVQVDSPISGGNFLGTLNGTTRLKASYCVNLNETLFPGTTYHKATVTTDGTIGGALVPNAGAIAWLLVHFGPTATTPIEQDALQAAIWRTEYGTDPNTGFQLDAIDNDEGAPDINSQIGPIYLADLAALGNNSAPVNTVAWINPGANPDTTPGQGLVALVPMPADLTVSINANQIVTTGGQTVLSLFAGEKLSVPVTVSNVGAGAANGTATVTLYLSTTPNLNGPKVLLGSKTVTLHLSGDTDPGETVTLDVTIPKTLGVGESYYVVARVSSTAIKDANPANNVAATAHSIIYA